MSNPECVNSFWEAYGNSAMLVEIEAEGPSGSLALHVLDVFNIDVAASTRIGGNLKGLDIKHMDAMAVINLSLLEELADRSGGMFEAIVNPDGEVEFVEIGGSIASLSSIYYQVQSFTYVEECKGVLLRGGNIMPSWKELDWKLIWGNGEGKDIFHTTQMVTNCMYDDFSTHATITFNDPHLDSEYDDGINNLYEIDSPWNKIIGYARFIDCPNATEGTKIVLNSSTVIPIEIGGNGGANGPYMGTLKSRPSHDPDAADYADCWQWTEGGVIGTASEGVRIDLPSSLRFQNVSGQVVDKFVKVEEILLVGQELSMVHSGALSDSVAATQEPSDINSIALISIDTKNQSIFKLEGGKHYAILYEDEDGFKQPYVLFAKDARSNEFKEYGQNTSYIISQTGAEGLVHAGETGVGTIFPLADNRGVLVQQIFAQVSLDTPAITVFDPEMDERHNQTRALDLAEELKFWVTPLMVEEPPSTIAFNGTIIDQRPAVQDNDPTVPQNFEDTPLELVYDTLDGGSGMELTLPFFNSVEDDAKLASLSASLYDFMNSGTGIDTTYVCGPDVDVSLGEVGPAGGVINSISYSYTDSGSYTISVNEGPRVIKNFSGGGPAGPSFKASESFSARGTIIASLGNGMFFKVRIDGYGERVAINMAPSILKVGDVVQCSVHNNPAEV